MPPALLYALARPLSLRVKGLGGAAQLALSLTTASRRCASRKSAVREVPAVRWCSGHTTFSQHTHLTETIDEDAEKSLTSLDSPRTHQTDLQGSDDSESFLLPSHHQQHQSNLLMAKINECEDVNVALEVYQRHREVMDAQHCLALFRKLSKLVSSGTDKGVQLLQKEDFKALSSQLFIQCRRMEVEELLDLLKHLCRLEVPANSKLTLAVLQIIKDQINDLSLRQLIFLDFLLYKMPLTPLSDALLTAIPILLTTAVASSSVTDLSLNDLSQAFTICCKGRVKGMGTLLQEIYNRGSVRSVTVAMNLMWPLTRISTPHLQKKLLTPDEELAREVIMKECLETIAKEIDALSFRHIESTLTKVCESHNKGDSICYNERFLHAIAAHTSHSSVSFEKATHITGKMVKMNYLPDELVKYTVQLVKSRPQDVPEARVGMLPLISALVAAPLPRDDLKAALDVIMTHKSLRLDSKEYYRKPLLMVALNLLSCGYFFPPLVKILTSSDSLSMLMSSYPDNSTNQIHLLMVDQALGEVFQSLVRVPEAFLEPARKLMAIHRPSRSSLKTMLLQILQDPNHLVSGVLTEGGTYIDHLLVLDPEGKPMRLRSADAPLMRNPSIASLDVPADATKVAILDIGSGSAFNPTNALKGQQQLRQNILEAAGYRVLPLLQTIIYQHREEEKMLYVKRELGGVGVATS